ncbi:hypothetical protein Bca101_019515 [Brassica carinata]
MCRHAVDLSRGGLTEALVKLPLLEELEVSYCSLSAESLKVVGQSCPNLKTLKLIRLWVIRFPSVNDNDDALAISESMHGLSHLQLISNKLTDAGIEAILYNCPDLEHLDLVITHIKRLSTISEDNDPHPYGFMQMLLNYIADRSSNLRSLRLIMCYPIGDEGFVEAVVKLPLLEYLEVTYGSLSSESLKVAGQSCPNLKKLRLNSNPDLNSYDDEFSGEDAMGIADSMPELRNLQLCGNTLTNTGLNAILDGCPHLDLCKCFNVRFEGGSRDYYWDDSTANYPYGTDTIESRKVLSKSLKTFKLTLGAYNCAEDALAIATASVPRLHRIQLIWKCLTANGLNGTLDILS